VTNQPLWQGKGVVPGPVEDAHTSQSEVYGLRTSLRFLVHYLTHSPMIYYSTRTITVYYCDNSRTVSHVTSLLQEKPTLTRSTIMDDYDVYAKIVQATQCLHLLRVQYMHIKGHQDKNQPVQTHTKPTQYNINCDKCTVVTLPDLAMLSTQCLTHPMPSSYPHLIIDCKVIVKDLQGAL